MSKGRGADATEAPTETVETALAELRAEATRLETAATDSRRGRWPANDYY